MSKLNICGVVYNNIDLNEFKNIIYESYAKKKIAMLIVTPNVDFIVNADKDKKFQNTLNNSDISVCDSAIVYFCSHLLKKSLKAKITGFDAMSALLDLANQKNDRVFLLGSREEVLQQASKNIKKDFPDLEVTGFHNGYFSDDDSDRVVDLINQSGANFLFIGMGSPRQELWALKIKAKVRVKYMICIGGLFDIFSGKVKRAPKFFQVSGIEWLWRFIKEPIRLWRRYFVYDMRFFYLFARDLFGHSHRNMHK